MAEIWMGFPKGRPWPLVDHIFGQPEAGRHIATPMENLLTVVMPLLLSARISGKIW